MTFRQFAFNNVIRNKRTYAAYFLSSVFSVMVFFVYAVFAFHPALEGGALHASVSVGMHFAEGIIYVFSFIFVLISMGAFLKSRKKEFGLLAMHGMTNSQLRKMVFLENIFIGLSATLSGILLGLVLAKTILLAAENILDLEQMLPFYFPKEALLLTFGAFILLFLLISLFTVSILKGHKLVDLIKGSSKPKTEPKSSVFLSWLAAILLALGYAAALAVRGLQVVLAMIPVTIVVIIGTYFLFTQLSVSFIHKWKGRRLFFWRKTNMILLSDLAYRMKDNARTFFFVAIVSTVAFSAIGSLVGFRAMMTDSLVEESPFAFEYWSKKSNKQESEHVALIEKRLEKESIPFTSVTMDIREIASSGEDTVWLVKATEYNRLANAVDPAVRPMKPSGTQGFRVVHDSPIGEKPQFDEEQAVSLPGADVALQPVPTVYSNVLPLYRVYFVVDDALFEKVKESGAEHHFYAFFIKNWQATSEIGKDLVKEMPETSFGGDYLFTSLTHQWNQINQAYGVILFIGLFIGAVFFVSAGSFLYFRLYADLEDDRRKFSAIKKLGLTERELSKVLTAQLILLFFVPIVVATVHGAVALTALQHMFNYSLAKPSALVLGSFFAIQVVYFLLIRSRYIRQIKSAI